MKDRGGMSRIQALGAKWRVFARSLFSPVVEVGLILGVLAPEARRLQGLKAHSTLCPGTACRTSGCNFSTRGVDYRLLELRLEPLGSALVDYLPQPHGGEVFPLFEAPAMEDELTQSPTPAAVEPESPAEPAAPEGALLLPYEESCKKVRELALRQLNRFISYEPKVLKGDDADAIHDMRVASRR